MEVAMAEEEEEEEIENGGGYEGEREVEACLWGQLWNVDCWWNLG